MNSGIVVDEETRKVEARCMCVHPQTYCVPPRATRWKEVDLVVRAVASVILFTRSQALEQWLEFTENARFTYYNNAC